MKKKTTPQPIRTLRLHGGQKMYALDRTTGEITLVTTKELTVDPKFLYVKAINVANAEKNFIRLMQENMKNPPKPPVIKECKHVFHTRFGEVICALCGEFKYPHTTIKYSWRRQLGKLWHSFRNWLKNMTKTASKKQESSSTDSSNA